MNPSKRRGTAWESAIVDYAQANGAPHAERRALNGAKDRGDVAGIPSVVIEAKDEAKHDLAGWANETERERINDGAAIGLTWIKRRGKASPGEGYVLMRGDIAWRLLREAGYVAGGTNG